MLRYYSLILILVFFLEGCQVQVQYPSEFPSKTIISSESNYWFWGLIGEKMFEVYDLCPQGRVYEVHIHDTFTQSSFTVLTLGIYSPRTITIVCSVRDE